MPGTKKYFTFYLNNSTDSTQKLGNRKSFFSQCYWDNGAETAVTFIDGLQMIGPSGRQVLARGLHVWHPCSNPRHGPITKSPVMFDAFMWSICLSLHSLLSHCLITSTPPAVPRASFAADEVWSLIGLRASGPHCEWGHDLGSGDGTQHRILNTKHTGQNLLTEFCRGWLCSTKRRLLAGWNLTYSLMWFHV